MPEETKDLEKREERSPVDAERVRSTAAFAPPVDIYETDEGAVLVADLPGCDREDVDIQYESGVLTIRGRVPEDRFPDHELTYAEYRAGDFERAFSVSELVDPEKIEATVRNGVLRVALPKAEEAKPRKIEIKTG
ncbi:MAG: Hsp20/alpha crystallin family protein [bacterium]